MAVNSLWNLHYRWQAVAKKEKMKRDVVRKMHLEGADSYEIAEAMNQPIEKVKRILGKASDDDYKAEWDRVCEPFRRIARDAGRI